jgi:hypothetical protein
MVDFWKRGPMGGEVHPDNTAIVFEESYAAGTYSKQDFRACVEATHTTYMKVWGLFNDYSMQRSEIDRANWNNARMGYSFQINRVAAKRSATNTGMIDVDVVIENSGVARFYYALSIGLNCSGIGALRTQPGVELIIDQFSNRTFSFKDVPATSACLNSISFTLESKMIFPGRPIKFAQGATGTVSVKVPLPPMTAPAPTKAPVTAPVLIPEIAASPIVLVLVDASTNKEYTLTTGATFNLKQVGYSLTMVAKMALPVGSKIIFEWMDGGIAQRWTESTAPYAINANTATTFTKLAYFNIPGAKEVSVTAISSTGAVITKVISQFNVIDAFFTFALVDTLTNKEHALLPEATVNLAAIGSSLTMIAKTTVPAGSKIEFVWMDGGVAQKWTESTAPYAIGANSVGSFTKMPYFSTPGAKEVTVTSLSSSFAIIQTQTIKFSIVNTDVSVRASALVTSATKSDETSFNYFLVDPNTKEDVGSVKSGAVIDLKDVGDELFLRVEL